MIPEIPKTQRAVQLVGPNQLVLNPQKPVLRPGPYQALCQVEAVGLCFSDLKLLKQFSAHPRKSGIVQGLNPAVLKEIPSYVPGDLPTVPGHETVVRVLEIGSQVADLVPGKRFLVQTDYRWLLTAESNAAFGYNFEGALQEFVLLDERAIVSPEGETTLIPVSDRFSASAIALIEPWACVENAYSSPERKMLKAGGRLLLAADVPVSSSLLKDFFRRFGFSSQVFWISGEKPPENLGVPVQKIGAIEDLKDGFFDDVLYFGSNSGTAEKLFPKLGGAGLINFILGGRKFGKPVSTAVGRIHYGGLRIIGTEGSNPASAMENIPANGEIRKGNRIQVVGAGGPMGLMHVIRLLSRGIEGITVLAGDLNAERLAILQRIAGPVALKNNAGLKTFNPAADLVPGRSDYQVIMVPVPALVQKAVENSAPNAILNLFAGIPAHVSAPLDMDAFIRKKLYFIGTSGSLTRDMRTVLEKVENGTLDTNLSVSAVSGLEGAIAGIQAIEKQAVSGKIIVYPSCKGLKLFRLEELGSAYPSLAPYVAGGRWSDLSEKELLKIFEKK